MIHDCSVEEQRRITGMTVGDFVMYTDIPDKMQMPWGGNDNPEKAGMMIGDLYEVVDIEIHDSYSHIMFHNIVGRFNSISFTIIDPEDKSDVAEMRDYALDRAKLAQHEFIKEFKDRADKWIINIQKCGLRLLTDCQDCILNENCQALREQLISMQANWRNSQYRTIRRRYELRK
jgi:hypothetical protein